MQRYGTFNQRSKAAKRGRRGAVQNLKRWEKAIRGCLNKVVLLGTLCQYTVYELKSLCRTTFRANNFSLNYFFLLC